MKIPRIMVAAMAAAMFLPVNIQAAVTDLPLTTVKGRKCYYYDVERNEAIYQVAQKLGVTREAIMEENPSAADGLKPNMRLYFDAAKYDAVAPGSRKAVYASAAGVTRHTVQKGETFYGIARRYGMSPDELARLNPGLSDGMRQGDVLIISDGDDEAAPSSAGTGLTLERGGDGYAIYEIKSGETLFSISNRAGVPLESILEANPDLDPMSYNPGDKIRIPLSSDALGVSDEVASAVIVDETPAPQAETAYNGEPQIEEPMPGPEAVDIPAESVVDTNAVAESQQPISIAVMLPFMLSEETPSRPAQLFTEFYKGMLMGAEKMLSSGGAPVTIEFFDTEGDADTLREILADPAVKDFDLVVAPDNPAHLAMVMEAVPEQTMVLNIFAVKDESYREHRNLIQTNIPHDDMYSCAIDRFMQMYADRTPVFIRRTGGAADKDGFTSGLKDRLIAEGRDFREVSFNTSLSDSDLAGIDPDETPVVFVPNTGSKTEFAKYVNAVTAMRRAAVDESNVTIFGYPEWVTFRGDSFDEICALDATIYSRYLAIDSDPAIVALKDKYKDTYGIEMFEAVPTQGILGYDTAVYTIEALREMERTGTFPSEFTGVQSRMKLDWSGAVGVDEDGFATSNGGLVNEALYFITFKPAGVVEWER